MSDRQHRLSAEERAAWERDGFVIRTGVFAAEENRRLNTIAEQIVAGTRPFPPAHVDRNALVRDGAERRSGIHAMHKLHFPSCYVSEFLQRVRDPRLIDPVVDLLGPDILGINNLYIWKAPRIGLGFPWHQDMFYFRSRFATETTVGTWTAFDAADRGNGCLYVIPGSHRRPIVEHDALEGFAAERVQARPQHPRRRGRGARSGARLGDLVPQPSAAQEHRQPQRSLPAQLRVPLPQRPRGVGGGCGCRPGCANADHVGPRGDVSRKVTQVQSEVLPV